MGFETKVLKVVADVVGNEKSAGFSYGEMDVYCTEDEARSIFHRLTKQFYSKVAVSRVDNYHFKFAFPL